MHWSDVHASSGRVGAIVNPVVDPVSGEPEFKHTPVRVAPFATDWQGFLLIRSKVALPAGLWWARCEADAHHRYEIEGPARTRPDADWLRAQLPEGSFEQIDYDDAGAGVHRVALLQEGRLMACLFIGPRRGLPSREWLGDLFGLPMLKAAARAALLTGRAPGARVDPGPLVCACHRVGGNTIVRAIGEGHTTLAAIGQCLRAGTNCGSCRSEIGRLLAQHHTPPKAMASACVQGPPA
jgi:assimilatory nitrate reductase catalytic subunit